MPQKSLKAESKRKIGLDWRHRKQHHDREPKTNPAALKDKVEANFAEPMPALSPKRSDLGAVLIKNRSSPKKLELAWQLKVESHSVPPKTMPFFEEQNWIVRDTQEFSTLSIHPRLQKTIHIQSEQILKILGPWDTKPFNWVSSISEDNRLLKLAI